MANKYGVFSEPTYISINDPYVKKEKENSRITGLNFKAEYIKTGKANDATFDKFKPLYESEKYQKDYKAKLEALEAEKKKRISDNPFKPSHPMKESSGLGNYFGCIGPKVLNMKAFNDVKHKKGDFECGPANVKTNPSKKGTYGFRATTLGEKATPGGAIGEYSYMAGDKYDAARRKEVEDAKASIAKRVADLPFKPANPGKVGGPGEPGLTINGKGPGVCGEYVYKELGPTPKILGDEFEKPFIPSNPPKLGYNCTVNRFPKYLEDPLDIKVQREKSIRKAEIERMNNQPRMIPPSVLKGSAVPSVLRMNLTLATE